MKTFVIIWTIAFIAVIAVMCTVDLSSYVPSIYTIFNKNRPLVSGVVYILLISVFIWLIVSLYLLKKYSFKVERLSLGGVNVLFNESGTLYRKSIKNHLDSKRAIFKLKENVDSFDEVISSYYRTYEFIREEMRILNPKKDRELYNLSNDMLMVLNKFLTENQNNYKRWYKHISDKDEIVDAVTNQSLTVHLTPIHEIQNKYYNYSKICDDFSVVNDFFTTRVESVFGINTNKWNW